MLTLAGLIKFPPNLKLPLPTPFGKRSSKSSPTPSEDLQRRVVRLANKMQIMAIKKPKQMLWMLDILERLVDRGIRGPRERP